jgi:hypothetical protein
MSHHVFAAGILPVTLIGGELYFILSRDTRDMMWSDFGGKSEPADRGDPFRTSLREFDEESLGCICPPQIMQRRLRDAGSVTHNSSRWLRYTMYIVPVPYMPWLRLSFLNASGFVRRHTDTFKKSILEKCDIQYVSVHDISSVALKDHFSSTLRIYWPIIMSICQRKLGIDASRLPYFLTIMTNAGRKYEHFDSQPVKDR